MQDIRGFSILHNTEAPGDAGSQGMQHLTQHRVCRIQLFSLQPVSPFLPNVPSVSVHLLIALAPTPPLTVTQQNSVALAPLRLPPDECPLSVWHYVRAGQRDTCYSVSSQQTLLISPSASGIHAASGEREGDSAGSMPSYKELWNVSGMPLSCAHTQPEPEAALQSLCQFVEVSMASAPAGPSPRYRKELYNRAIQQARKIRSDLDGLLDAYVESQGLDKDMNLDSVDGIPLASTDRFGNLTEAERLEFNVKAYQSFQDLLSEVLEDQQLHLTPSHHGFHENINAILLQVMTLSNQLEELMTTLGHKVPEQVTGVSGAKAGSYYEKKLKGYKVLLELSQWTLRSIRDLRQLSSRERYQGMAGPSTVFRTIRVRSQRVVVHNSTK